MTVSKEQSYKIQMLRGLAIIAVVLIHNTPGGMAQVYVRPFINFSVGLFLFMSGLLSDASRWSPWKRIKKVLIPYVIWTLIYVVLNCYKTPMDIPLSFAKGLLAANTSAVMYYVFVYCAFTLLLPLIDKLARSKWKYVGFALTPLEIIAVRLVPLILGIELNKYILILRTISFVGWFTYFYLGYLIGQNLIEVKIKTRVLSIFLVLSLALQMAEGYWYLSMGEDNCGTQLKLSTVLTGVIFVVLCYRFICSKVNIKSKVLHLLGDYSFGIFFSHIAVMIVLSHIPYYSCIIFPVNALIVIAIDCGLIFLGRKILRKFAKYLAL